MIASDRNRGTGDDVTAVFLCWCSPVLVACLLSVGPIIFMGIQFSYTLRGVAALAPLVIFGTQVCRSEPPPPTLVLLFPAI